MLKKGGCDGFEKTSRNFAKILRNERRTYLTNSAAMSMVMGTKLNSILILSWRYHSLIDASIRYKK